MAFLRLTSRLKVHADEIIEAEVRGNVVRVRFVCLKKRDIPVDDLTPEARAFLVGDLNELTDDGAFLPDEDEIEIETPDRAESAE